MTMSAILAIEVGGALSLRDAVDVAEAAAERGVTALRIRDGAGSLDPTAVAAHLAALVPTVNWLVDAPTTRNAPYNLARRVLSLDRATAGRTGLVLRAGDGDEVSDAAVPDPGATSQAARWAEYAHIVTSLWQSFPRKALLGDQEAGIFADDSLISGIGHEGAFYRVQGALDGPTSVQGRPVLVADDLAVLGWDVIAAAADVAVVPADLAVDAATSLTAALERSGRPREAIALIGRAPAGVTQNELAEWVERHHVDGVELVAADRAEAARILETELVRFRPAPGETLRGAVGPASSTEYVR